MADSSEQGSLLGKIAAYTELLDKDPRSTIFVPLCDAYRQLDLLEEAADIVKKGLMEHPAFSTGYVAYGHVLTQQGLTDEAIAEFEKALILDRKNLPALKALAKVQIQQGSHVQARKLLEQALSINSDDASVAEMLALVESKLSRAPSAVETVAVSEEQMIPAEKSDDPISTATIAEIYIRQGFPEKALKVYRDLLRADPQNDHLRHKLIDLKERLANEKVDIELPGVASVTEVPVPESSGLDSALDVVMEDTVLTQTVSSDEPVSRSVVDIFAGWLDSISRRREAHVR